MSPTILRTPAKAVLQIYLMIMFIIPLRRKLQELVPKPVELANFGVQN